MRGADGFVGRTRSVMANNWSLPTATIVRASAGNGSSPSITYCSRASWP